jgi:hypothetical protein
MEPSEVDVVTVKARRRPNGPRRVRILGAEKASVVEVHRIAIARSWQERIALPTLPFPDHANGWGSPREHP